VADNPTPRAINDISRDVGKNLRPRVVAKTNVNMKIMTPVANISNAMSFFVS